jgi:CubicO group peptidase (beta-lactamase class C family)
MATRREFVGLLLASTASGLLPGCATRPAASSAYDDGFPRARSESAGVSPAAVTAWLDEMQAAKFEMHSFMLYRRGHVIAEGWWAPYRADRIHMTHSLTKSVSACAVGFALAERRFALQDKVVSFFREELPATIDPKLAAMTVEDLLTMRTGHAAAVSGAEWRPIRTSWVAEFFKIPVVKQPGTEWLYTSAATYMLSAIVTKTTGQKMADYLRPRLFVPLGIEGYEWDPDPHGITPGANGLSWRTADSLKLGVLHLQKGKWNGKQVLPVGWADAVQAPHVKDKYGYQWWLAPDNYSARGLFGQFTFVFPKDDAVLAVTSAVPKGFTAIAFKHFPAAFRAGAMANDDAALATLTTRTRGLQLLPPPGKSSSQVAGRISGKRYTMEPNEDAIRAIQLDFAEGRCRFTLVDDRGTHTIDAGLGTRIEGNTTMTGNKLHHEYQPDVMRVVADGEWDNASTFAMTWVFVESAFQDRVVCRFDGDRVTFERSVNVNSGPTTRPAVRGNAA